MNIYERGKIYAIRSIHSNEVYIGSTIGLLSRRKNEHKSHYKRYLEGTHHYISSFKILELGNYYIELVENYPCESKDELHRREGQIMRETENCVNMLIAGRTKSEYREDNKEQINQKKAQHYQYNKEKIKQKSTQYRADNKEAIAQRKATKYTCECGSILRIADKLRHERSIKHQEYEDAQYNLHYLFD
jgi:hypothetical protein